LTIYLIRHGESEHNVDHTVMKHTHDSKHSLTEIGQKQVKITAEFMKNLLNEKTVIYSSPYLRTKQTAKAIQSVLPFDVPFIENPLLREWEMGNLYDVHHRPPELKKEFKAAGQFYFRFQNGESLADVYLRASTFVNTVLQRLQKYNHYENVVVVSHAAWIQMLLIFLMEWPIDNETKLIPMENASVITVNEVDGKYQHEKVFVPNVN
jgi:broad specificity phosphatase PhoE